MDDYARVVGENHRVHRIHRRLGDRGEARVVGRSAPVGRWRWARVGKPTLRCSGGGIETRMDANFEEWGRNVLSSGFGVLHGWNTDGKGVRVVGLNADERGFPQMGRRSFGLGLGGRENANGREF